MVKYGKSTFLRIDIFHDLISAKSAINSKIKVKGSVYLCVWKDLTND